MTEAEYWADYQVTEAEVVTAIESFYAYIEINNYADEDDSVLRGLNEAPTYWVTVHHALIAMFIITLGRIFDEGAGAHSIRKLLNATSAHPEYFSRAALNKRRRPSSGDSEPIWLADLLRNAWEPDAKDLRVFRRKLAPSIKKYEAVYEPIRSKVFAHKGLKDGASIGELFDKTSIIEVEEILKALHIVLVAIFQLYHNGTKPQLGGNEYGYKERIERVKTTTRCALARVKATGSRG
jgi:hypothetical protein